MGHSKKTPIIRLPQFTESDKPSFLGDINGAFALIDNEFTRLQTVIAEQNRMILALQNRELNK